MTGSIGDGFEIAQGYIEVTTNFDEDQTTAAIQAGLAAARESTQDDADSIIGQAINDGIKENLERDSPVSAENLAPDAESAGSEIGETVAAAMTNSWQNKLRDPYTGKFMAAAITAVTSDASDAGAEVGDAVADNLFRDSKGRLHDSAGKFVSDTVDAVKDPLEDALGDVGEDAGLSLWQRFMNFLTPNASSGGSSISKAFGDALSGGLNAIGTALPGQLGNYFTQLGSAASSNPELAAAVGVAGIGVGTAVVSAIGAGIAAAFLGGSGIAVIIGGAIATIARSPALQSQLSDLGKTVVGVSTTSAQTALTTAQANLQSVISANQTSLSNTITENVSNLSMSQQTALAAAQKSLTDAQTAAAQASATVSTANQVAMNAVLAQNQYDESKPGMTAAQITAATTAAAHAVQVAQAAADARTAKQNTTNAQNIAAAQAVVDSTTGATATPGSSDAAVKAYNDTATANATKYATALQQVNAAQTALNTANAKSKADPGIPGLASPSFTQPLSDSIATLKAGFISLEPAIGQTFAAIAPAIAPLTTAFVAFVQGAMPGFLQMVTAATPFLITLTEKAAPFGAAMSQFFKDMATAEPGALVFMQDMIVFLADFLRASGATIIGLSTMYKWIHNLFGQQAEHDFEPIWLQVLIRAFEETGKDISNWAVDSYVAVNTFFDKVGGLFTGWYRDSISDVKTWAGDFVKFWTDLPGEILNELTDLPAQLVKVVQNASTAMLFAVGFGLGMVLKEFTQLPQQVFDTLSDAAHGLWALNVTVFDDFTTRVSGWASEAVTDVVNEIKKLPGDVFDALSDGVTGLWHALESVFNDTGTNTRAAGKSIVGDFLSFFQDLPANVISLIKDLPGDLIAFFKDADTWLVQVGKDVWDGLIQGIKDGISDTLNIVTGVAKTIISGFASGFDIGSPSKLMASQIGVPIMQGIGVGMVTGTPPLLAQVKKIPNQLTGALKSGSVGVGGTGAGMGGQIINIQPGGVTLDASKISSIQDLITMINGLQATSRQFVSGVKTVQVVSS